MTAVRKARLPGAGTIHRLPARFAALRHVYSSVRRIQSPPCMPASPLSSPSVFVRTDFDSAFEALRRDSVALGFDLRPAVVGEIMHFARTTPCDFYGRSFYPDEIADGRLPDGTQIVHAGVPEPERCEAIARLCGDPALLAMAERHLRYSPKKIIPRLFWSFACSATAEERRRQNQSIDWTYDLHDFNFGAFNFYLTDVDKEGGPHAVIRGSHRRKPLRLLRSATATEQEIVRHYGRSRELVIEGPPGTGFFEDSACYNRVVPPTGHDRLLLEIWFS